jgi:hypothetical protein
MIYGVWSLFIYLGLYVIIFDFICLIFLFFRIFPYILRVFFFTHFSFLRCLQTSGSKCVRHGLSLGALFPLVPEFGKLFHASDTRLLIVSRNPTLDGDVISCQVRYYL